jgi:hypothetical protein
MNSYPANTQPIAPLTVVPCSKKSRSVRPSKVDNSGGGKSHSGKVGQPPDSKHRADGGNAKCWHDGRKPACRKRKLK